jgi:hypothetical protein
VEKCVKCGGFHLQENCEAAACKWYPDNKVKCGGNPEIFLLPVNSTGEMNEPTTSKGNRFCSKLGQFFLSTFFVVLSI